MKTSRLLTTVLVVVLIASLCVPAVALAAKPVGRGGGQGKGNGVGQGLLQGQGGGQGNKELRQQNLLDRLTARIERMIKLRQAKFDRAEARLGKRIERLGAIASRAETMGVDVSEAKASLETAKGLLKIAAAEEADAQDLFRAVITASDKRAAFAEARAQARVAQKALQKARLEVVRALRLLHKAVDESKVWSPNATPTVSPTP